MSSKKLVMFDIFHQMCRCSQRFWRNCVGISWSFEKKYVAKSGVCIASSETFFGCWLYFEKKISWKLFIASTSIGFLFYHSQPREAWSSQVVGRRTTTCRSTRAWNSITPSSRTKSSGTRRRCLPSSPPRWSTADLGRCSGMRFRAWTAERFTLCLF